MKGKKMKALLINGSPHKHGCTDAALNEVVKGIKEYSTEIETEIFWLGTGGVHGCIACGKCAESGFCVFNDDPCNEILKKAESADGFVFGSPVYYAGAAGVLTAVLDRCFFAGNGGGKSRFNGNPGAAVCSASRAGTTATLDRLNKYFSICEMPIIGSQYWNMVHGLTAEDVMKDEEGCQIMRTLGKNMAYWLKVKDLAEKSGVPYPAKEIPLQTNFIK
jgi:multimeric flavodoxin WrbA